MSATTNTNVVELRPRDRVYLVDLAAEINQHHETAQGLATVAVAEARKAGLLLIQAKALVAHGQWLPWLSTNCPEIAARTAQEYMQIAGASVEKIAEATTISGALSIIRDRPRSQPPKSAEAAHLPPAADDDSDTRMVIAELIAAYINEVVDSSPARDVVAEVLKVHRPLIDAAQFVSTAAPELIGEIKAGKLDLMAAVRVAADQMAASMAETDTK